MKSRKKTVDLPETGAIPAKLVVNSSDLVHAKYSMTLWQKRLFVYAASQLRREDKDFGWQRIYFAELINYFEAGGGKKTYDAIREAPKQLDMSIEVPYRDEGGNFRYAFVKILSGYTIPGDEGERNRYVELKFNDDLKSHLLDLKERFLRYELENVKRLRSVYSFRLYEFLKSYEFQHREIRFEVDYLREVLQLEDTYRLYTDFRRNVIEKAREDLSKECDITFEYRELTKGKKVVSLVFTIIKNPLRGSKSSGGAAARGAILLPAAQVGEGEMGAADGLFNELESLVIRQWGVSPSSFSELLKKHSPDQIQQAVRVTKRRATKGTLENKAGFFVEAVKKGYTDEVELKAEKQAKARLKTQKLADLQRHLTELQEEFRVRLLAQIKELTDVNPSATDRAVEAVKTTDSPTLRKKIDSLGPTVSIDDFRRDEYLREKVIEEIQRQNEPHFAALRVEFQEKHRLILEEIKGAKAG